MKRITSSLRPGGSVSCSMSVTKPALYSACVRAWISWLAMTLLAYQSGRISQDSSARGALEAHADRGHDGSGPAPVAVVDLGHPQQVVELARGGLVADARVHADKEALAEVEGEADVHSENGHRPFLAEGDVLDRRALLLRRERDQHLVHEAHADHGGDVGLEPGLRRQVV